MAETFSAGSFISPQVKSRRKMADLLLENATRSEPVYGWGQALAKVLAGAAAGYNAKKADEQEVKDYTEAPSVIGSAERRAADQWTDPDTGQKVGADKQENYYKLLGNSGNPIAQQYGLMSQMGDIERKKKLQDDMTLLGAKNAAKGGGAVEVDPETGALTEVGGGGGGLNNKNYQKKTGEFYGEIPERVAAANKQAADFKRLDSLLAGTSDDQKLGYGGAGKYLFNQGASVLANVAGYETPGMDKDIKEYQLIQGLLTANALSEAAKLKGAVSNYEDVLVKQASLAEKGTTKAALQEYSEAMQKYIQSATQRAKFEQKLFEQGYSPSQIQEASDAQFGDISKYSASSAPAALSPEGGPDLGVAKNIPIGVEPPIDYQEPSMPKMPQLENVGAKYTPEQIAEYKRLRGLR